MNVLVFLFAFCLFGVSISSSQLVGGWTEIDLNNTENDEFFQHSLDFAVQHAKDFQNTINKIVLKEVVKAKKQLVSGVNYDITLVLGHTNCIKSVTYDAGECNIERLQTCNVIVYYVPWQNLTEVTSILCGAFTRVKRSLLGGIERADENEARDALNFAVEQLNKQGNGFYELSIHDIILVNKQMVSGVKYSASVRLTMKSCSKKLLTLCHDDIVEELTKCNIVVVDQPWMNPQFTLVNSECDGAIKMGKLKFVSQQEQQEDEEDGEHEKLLRVKNMKKVPDSQAFGIFKTKYNKVYSNDREEEVRMEIFKKNMERAEFYQNHDLGTAVYGATQFADLTEKEFSTKYLSKVWDKRLNRGMKEANIPYFKEEELPKEFDWRNHDAVTSVKNQKSCGSCWAFSVVGNIEGQWAIKKRTLFDLSAQELVDCDKLDEGCNGGLPSLAYEEIQRLGGLEVEEDYPYHGRDEQCSLNKEKIKVYINGSVNISSNEADMAAWLVSNGPMSIGINALFMQFYMGGISHPWSLFCPTALNHGVVIVGYGVRKRFFWNTPFWIVKNSWGTNWGEHGYYLVYRGGGTCGLNLMVSSAVID